MDAAGPILLIPKHALSPELIVGDFGHVRVTNKTLYDGQDGTITFLRRQREARHQREEEEGEGEGSDEGGDESALSSHASVQSQLSTITVDDASVTQSQQFARRSVSSSGLQGSVFSQVYEKSTLFAARSPDFPPWGTGWSTHFPYMSPSEDAADNSLFGSRDNSAAEMDKRQIEKKLEAVKGPCLLDCIELVLSEVDVFSAKRVDTGTNKFKIVRQVS